jgi:hypothetical protein
MGHRIAESIDLFNCGRDMLWNQCGVFDDDQGRCGTGAFCVGVGFRRWPDPLILLLLAQKSAREMRARGFKRKFPEQEELAEPRFREHAGESAEPG